MKITPEMIDAATIQLRTLFTTDESIPQNVRDKGTAFVDALDAWSEEMKLAAINAK
jgi:uncharacterized protein (UPF0147 family)